MGVRKEKAARLKIHILDTSLKLVGKKTFDDLYVDDLCDRVKISKVTFFKYFPCKEDVLLYFFRIWSLSRVIELRDKRREGIQGIYYLFEKLGEDCESRPGLMKSLVAYLADFKKPPKPFPVKAEEKLQLFPSVRDVNALEIFSVDQMMERFIYEAISRKEIGKSSTVRDITNLLLTTFYGSVISAHTRPIGSAKVFFRKNVDMILKGIR